MGMGRNESKFWQLLKRNLAAPDWCFDRIESGLTNRGIPDVSVSCKRGGDCWLELKVLPSGVKVKLSMNQVHWHEKRSECGSRTWIVIRLTDPDKILLYRGNRARDLSNRGIALAPDAEFSAPVDWQLFRRTLYR